MKGLSTQGSGVDYVVSVCQHFLQRQGKRPKVHAKQKGFKNFFKLEVVDSFWRLSGDNVAMVAMFKNIPLQSLSSSCHLKCIRFLKKKCKIFLESVFSQI